MHENLLVSQTNPPRCGATLFGANVKKMEKDSATSANIYLRHDKEAIDSAGVHLLPFAFVNFEGPARLSTYFNPKKDEEKGCLKFSFRGRTMCGKQISLPKDCTGTIPFHGQHSKGIIFEEQLQQEENERMWVSTKFFDDFHYWNREIEPSNNDLPVKWMNWPKISQSVRCSSF